MRLLRPSSALLLLGAACAAVVPSCYRIELTLERFDVGGAAGDAGGAAGQAADVGGSAGAPAPGGLGNACEDDRDCSAAPGLSCLRASSSSDPLGAPAKGLCTTACSSDTDCTAYGEGAVCGSFAEPPLTDGVAPIGAKRWCLEGCSLGGPSGSDKCHGRAEMACRPFAGPNAQTCPTGLCSNTEDCFRGWCRAAACGPRCNDDSDCPTGRYCDAQSGLCDSTPSSIVAIGTTCGTESTPTCGDGVCLEAVQSGTAVEHICSQSCRLGSPCANGTGACVLSGFPKPAIGDVGYCAKVCNCDDQCGPDRRCYAWKNPELGTQLKSLGQCEPTQVGVSSLDCASGGAGSK